MDMEGTRTLRITMSERMADRVDEMAQRRGIEAPELVRRALAVLSMTELMAEQGILFVDIRTMQQIQDSQG